MISSFGEICPITLLENIQRSYHHWICQRTNKLSINTEFNILLPQLLPII